MTDAYAIDMQPKWDPVEPEDIAEWRGLQPGLAPDWIPLCTYCDDPVPATHHRVCNDCDATVFACAPCMKAQDVDDISIRRWAKMFEVIGNIATRSSSLDQQIAALEAERVRANEEGAKAAFDFLWPQLAASKDAIEIDEHQVSFIHKGQAMFTLPRPAFPGETDEDVKRSALRSLVDACLGAAHSFGDAIGENMRQTNPAFLVQCDDHGPIDDEHVAAVVGKVHKGTAEELAQANERLRKCARPARAFRRGDQVDIFVHGHHDCGEGPAS